MSWVFLQCERMVVLSCWDECLIYKGAAALLFENHMR